MQLSNNRIRTITSLTTPRSRRTALRGLAAGLLVAGLGPGVSRIAAQDAGSLPDELVPPQGPTFVGPTSDPETLVGIVFPDDRPGQAVAYLCRGAELSVWFTGQVQDGALALTGPDPREDATPPPGLTLTEPTPTLHGRLEGDLITGDAELLDRTLTFTAIPAEGLAGLYVTERDEAGIVLGASSTGATLRARQSEATGAAAEIAPYQVTGTVVTADGGHYELTIPSQTDVPAVFRWVALADGTVRGAGRRRGTVQGAAGENGSIESSSDLDRPNEGDGFVDKIIEI